jgi:hypothetical protein
MHFLPAVTHSQPMEFTRAVDVDVEQEACLEQEQQGLFISAVVIVFRLFVASDGSVFVTVARRSRTLPRCCWISFSLVDARTAGRSLELVEAAAAVRGAVGTVVPSVPACPTTSPCSEGVLVP